MAIHGDASRGVGHAKLSEVITIEVRSPHGLFGWASGIALRDGDLRVPFASYHLENKMTDFKNTIFTL